MVNMAYPMSFQNFEQSWKFNMTQYFLLITSQYLTHLCVLFCDMPFHKTIEK